MQNKFFFNAVKCFFYFGLFIVTVSFSYFFIGCSGSEEETVVDQRNIDSINVYTKIQKSFALYKKALDYNESGDDSKANSEFESALRQLNEIHYEIISRAENYFWKKDYEELAKSIVEDYFITQSEISDNSLIFDFAKRVSVEYEKIEQYSGDREPLPNGSDVPLVLNSAVEEYIEFFSNTDRGRTFIDKCLYRSGKYFPIMRKILKYNNAPEELIYLSVQESGLAPTIVSRAGAVGLWQFMPATGYAYGLDQDGYRDDRRDFEKSTDAAARHLKDLYRTYDDWYLAFAAYNAGPGRVNSAINRSGSHDYWSLRGYLPGETKNYVPSILALSFVLRSPEEYGFQNIEYGSALSFDRVNVQSSLSLQKIAELCDTDIEIIRELNPEITNDEIPVYDVSYHLRIPENTFNKFAANYNRASDIDKSGHSPEFVGSEIGVGSNLASIEYKVKHYSPDNIRAIGSTKDKNRVTHEFKDKDVLSVVAIYYEVRPTDIRIWNNISYGTYPQSKQKLSIYITNEKYKILHGKNDIQQTIIKEEVNEKVISENSDHKTNSEVPANVNEKVIAKETDKETTNSSETIQSPTDDNTKTTVEERSTESIPENVQQENEADLKNYEEPQVEKSTESDVSEVSTKKKNISGEVYTVSEGDYLSHIAKDFGVSISDLKEWNNLKDDKILVGQKLKIYSPNEKITIHIVEKSENLTLIAKEYNLSVSKLKELNDLDNDVLVVGQKLKVIETKKINIQTSAGKKTHKVKTGETLASIAELNKVTIQNLKTWNNLKSDKILVDQVLKLYDDSSTKKSKLRKKKNNKD